jgi:hypothetical protein
MRNGQRGPCLVLHGILRRLPGLAARTGLLALLVFAPLAPAGGSEELPAPERHQVVQGDLVVKTREVEDYPWPEVTVYRQVAASPEEVMAVYADFESQADYLPNLVYSRIVERLARNSFQVSYEYEVTGPNERYTVLVVVRRSGDAWQATWDLVKARYARRLSGQMKVAAFEAGTLLEYTNRVDPGFFGVHLGSPETTVRQLRATVQALTIHVERLRVEHPERLQAAVRALRAMLGEP